MVTLSCEELPIEALKTQCAFFSERTTDIHTMAHGFVSAIRKQDTLSAYEAFQAEYNLHSEEGLLLMCIAEALLRIPDSATADALIRDKLAFGHWDAHIGLGRPWFINWAGYGLELAGKVADAQTLERSAGAFMAHLVHRLGEPVVRAALRHAMKLMGEVFVLAQDMPHALKHAAVWHRKGYSFSFDMLGEGARSKAQADAYYAQYADAIRQLAQQSEQELFSRDGISIKLSALHPRFELRQWDRLEKELLPALEALAVSAARHGIPLTIDAEEATRAEVTLKLFSALIALPALRGYEGLGLAVQAYRIHAHHTLEALAALAAQHHKRLPIRLVKGAYWDSEIKRAQMEGLPAYPVFTHKHHTDISYLACAEFMLAQPHLFYPQFATHNAHTVAAILTRAKDQAFEFQRLHGMGEALHQQVRETHHTPCRIYAPVGKQEALLSYLIRRILENGANASFVRSLADSRVDVQSLIADPLSIIAEESLPLPKDIYAPRKNSTGCDMGDSATLAHWQRTLNTQHTLPAPPPEAEVESAYLRAQTAFAQWSVTPLAQRIACIHALADRVEARRDALVALLVHEAGKTVTDAVAEVREAADFCRYYAQEAERLFTPLSLTSPTGEKNILTLHPRGVWVAISPWNFPLAIFTGQLVAALITGNCVLAKPAEQTPRIAALATALMHEAGIGKDVLQLVPGRGETVGDALVRHPHCAGVVFTGGTQTARAIYRTLATKDGAIVPLIAETGGQNCMVVDSSALLEHTVDDIIASAFLSAGQRCSALRVVFVQEEIADALSTLLAGAMQELRVGDPSHLATDIGAVIDEEAASALHRHIAQMARDARLLAVTPKDAELGARYISPHLFEIPSIHLLQGEVFGPILHLVRFAAAQLPEVIAQINSTGYGLTFGIQSRIDATIELLSSQVQAGNIYINRAMTGAVVGVQPFGGNGLSGTGPKAGGPHYLYRFCHERTITTNTSAIGGNIDLLAKSE